MPLLNRNRTQPFKDHLNSFEPAEKDVGMTLLFPFCLFYHVVRLAINTVLTDKDMLREVIGGLPFSLSDIKIFNNFS